MTDQSRFVCAPGHEARHPKHPTPGPALCLQWGHYLHPDGSKEWGYRFIWRRDDGSIQSRGPARLPSLADVLMLTSIAIAAKWGCFDEDHP